MTMLWEGYNRCSILWEFLGSDTFDMHVKYAHGRWKISYFLCI